MRILEGPEYIRLPPRPFLCQDTMIEYAEASRNIAAAFNDSDLFKVLLSDCGNASGLIARLERTVKSHKPAGSVSMRALHACPRSPFRPGMRFISKILQKSM